MKIVLVCRVYPTQRPGGMGFVCQDRANELAAQGHEVHVLTTGSDGPGDGIVQVHYVGGPATSYSEQFASGCYSACSRLVPDIIHLDSLDFKHPWWSDVTRRESTVLGITMHGFCWGAWMTEVNLAYRDTVLPPTFPPDEFDRERRVLSEFDRVIGISLHEHWLMRHMMSLFDAQLVYNPIAPYFFENRKVPEVRDRRRYLCAAVSGTHKRGFHIAVEAVRKAGAEIVTMSNASRTSMPNIIDDCDALLLPTAYAQGLDLTVGECLARYRPAIVTATGSYLREGEAGGAYHESIQLVPLVDHGAAHLTEVLKASPPIVSSASCEVHRPSRHVARWLEVMQ